MNRKISTQLRDVMRKTWQFENITSLQEFLKNENDFWTKSREGISQPSDFFSQRNVLLNSIRKLENWNDKIVNWDDTQLQNEMQNFQQNDLNALTSYWLWSGHAWVPAWINACKISHDVGEGFLEYIKDKRVSNIQNSNFFKGYLLAYEFEMQDETNILQRRKSEKASYNQLRDRLDSSANKLIAKVDEFENEFTTWSENTKTMQSSEFSVDQQTRQDLFESTQQEKDNIFQTMIKNYKDEMNRLETTYHEKLRLEKPAQYWNTKASEYKIQAEKWSKGLAGLLVGGIAIFSVLFYFWSVSFDFCVELKSMQGAILFITLITIYAIAVQAVSKMVFSSYHLQRDAEEREQLAYVYLALTNEQNHIDEESRKIVLQALFSRADTGLLKDSSPTMPGVGITELFKNVNR